MLKDLSFDSLLQQPQALEEVASSESVKCSNKPVPALEHLQSGFLGALKQLKKRITRMKGHNINNVTKIDCSVGRQKLSTEEIIRVAGERYVKFSAYWDDNICMPMHPYESSLGGLSEEENRDVELVQFLLAAAESRLRTLRTSKTIYFYTVNRTHQLVQPLSRKLSTFSLKHCERGSTGE
ncbi:hypothetical protein K1719_024735 [Acacia pycnantha]|nr:hypothetical protein K1719_024735 [Acacia pycnantha]